MLGHPAITMAEIRRLYGSGEYRHWFDLDTMRFWGTRLPARGVRTPHGNYFITAEHNAGGGHPTMRYTIRVQDPESGDISSVGGYQLYPDYVTAKAGMQRHLEHKLAEVDA